MYKKEDLAEVRKKKNLLQEHDHQGPYEHLVYSELFTVKKNIETSRDDEAYMTLPAPNEINITRVAQQIKSISAVTKRSKQSYC